MSSAAVGIFVAIAAVLVLQLVSNWPTRNMRQSVRRLRAFGNESKAEFQLEPGASPVWRALQKLGDRILPLGEQRSEFLRNRLASAGYTHAKAPLYFMAARLILVVATAVLGGLVTGTLGAAPAASLLWAAVGGAAGFLAPSYWLVSSISSRQRAIRNALPDALDIMVLSVEGGANLNSAIAWVTEEIQSIHPLLETEMVTVQKEIQLGLSAGEAFLGFAERCHLEEVRELANAILQSERYGASVAKTLRTHTETARQERQMWAEEFAQKAGVKIMFPMLLCIFPAMFIVLLGPAAFQLSKLFVK